MCENQSVQSICKKLKITIDETEEIIPPSSTVSSDPGIDKRIIGQKYIYNEEIRIWNGYRWMCEHGKQKNKCINCNGSSVCNNITDTYMPKELQFIISQTIDHKHLHDPITYRALDLLDEYKKYVLDNYTETETTSCSSFCRRLYSFKIDGISKTRGTGGKERNINMIIINFEKVYTWLIDNKFIDQLGIVSKEDEQILPLPRHIKDRILNRKYMFDDKIVIWDGTSLRCKHNRTKHKCNVCIGESISDEEIPYPLLPKKESRIVGQIYMYRGEIKIWDGKRLKCKHNKIISVCRDCKGSSICEHDKKRSTCKKCKGGGICEHDKIRSDCVECNGGSICEHGKRRSRCIKCGGSNICEHNKIRESCKECGGSSICEHDRSRTQCKDCGGGHVCEHGNRRSHCLKCFTHPEYWCILCKYIYVNRCAYYPYCFNCYCYLNPDIEIPRRRMFKHNYIYKELTKYFPDIINDKKINEGCSKRRPDGFIECFTHSIILEYDENQHRNYSCENKRMMEIFQDLGNRPIIFIRFNPDKYIDDNEKLVEGCFYFDDKNKLQVNDNEWSVRLEKLILTIKESSVIPLKEITIIQLFYNRD